jgi:hypothetical protein
LSSFDNEFIFIGMKKYLKIADIDEEVFASLPQDIKLEICMNYKEGLKKNKANRAINDFPEASLEVSKRVDFKYLF